jgi:hypothetical protein
MFFTTMSAPGYPTDGRISNSSRGVNACSPICTATRDGEGQTCCISLMGGCNAFLHYSPCIPRFLKPPFFIQCIFHSFIHTWILFNICLLPLGEHRKWFCLAVVRHWPSTCSNIYPTARTIRAFDQRLEACSPREPWALHTKMVQCAWQGYVLLPWLPTNIHVVSFPLSFVHPVWLLYINIIMYKIRIVHVNFLRMKIFTRTY